MIFEIVNEKIEEVPAEFALMYEQCSFVNCDFTGTDISKITFVDCSFDMCNLSSLKCGGTVLSGVAFNNCKLVGIHFSDFAQETMDISFKGCRLDSAVFENLTLKKVAWGESDLLRCEFIWSNFTGADFSGCDLRESRFINCVLEKTDFRGITNLDIDIRENRVTDAKFSILSAVDLLTPMGILFD